MNYYSKRSQKAIWVSTDSEWHGPTGEWLSTAFRLEDRRVIFITSKVSENVNERLTRYASTRDVQVIFTEMKDDTCLLEDALDYFLVSLPNLVIPRHINLLLFYSPKDAEYAFGWDTWNDAILKDKSIRQRNGLSGRLNIGAHVVAIKDLYGLASNREGSSLARFADAMGVPMADKGLMDDYKSHMYDGLVEHPEQFLDYATGDLVLEDVLGSFVTMFRRIQAECLGMTGDDLWTTDTIPMKRGTLMAATLENWLCLLSGNADIIKLCCRKIGLLDEDHKHYPRSVDALNLIRKKVHSVDDLQALMGTEAKHLLSAKMLATGLDACSVRWWASRPQEESAGYLALVQGGRCHNERPDEYRLERGLDIDISGCYGSALRDLIYPIGLPSTWNYTSNEGHTTFGAWLDANQADLVPGLWFAVVSGALSFTQDIILSKLVRRSDIWKASAGNGRDGGDDGPIPSDLVLLRQQIEKGIITADVLRILRGVASNAEWACIRRLNVVAACGYLARNRHDDWRSWCNVVLADKGEYRFVGEDRIDSRSRAWLAVRLEDFVGSLVEQRKHYKRQGKEGDARAAGMDEMLKNCINTVYGVLVSRFFRVGNTCLGNNITARARVGVWMMAKALGCRQTITDGGAYRPEEVCWFTGKKPGLGVFSRPAEWHDKRRERMHLSLAKFDWPRNWTKLPSLKEMDEWALAHVREFWRSYDLEFPFLVEHKRPMDAFTWWSKGDYAWVDDRGEVHYKLRGKDQKRKTHPSFGLLKNILQGDDAFPREMAHEKGSLLKVGKYRVIQESNGYEWVKHLRPGDEWLERRVARYNNTWMPLDSEADFMRRKKRKVRDHGKDVLWFERFAQAGIKEVHRKMTKDELR